MSIVISNVESGRLHHSRPHRYLLEIGEHVQVEFEHVPEHGLAVCLRAAAKAVDAADLPGPPGYSIQRMLTEEEVTEYRKKERLERMTQLSGLDLRTLRKLKDGREIDEGDLDEAGAILRLRIIDLVTQSDPAATNESGVWLLGWHDLRDKVLPALEGFTTLKNTENFEKWFSEELSSASVDNTAAPRVSHVSWGLDCLRISNSGNDEAISRLMRCFEWDPFE